MSDYIEMIREFSHADGVYPVKYRPGIYEVVARQPGQGEVSRRCAEVALETGAAVDFDKAAADKAAAERAAVEKAAAEKAAVEKAAAERAAAEKAAADKAAADKAAAERAAAKKAAAEKATSGSKDA